MKKAMAALLILLGSTAAHAGEVRIKWEYPIDTIRNFTIYCDGDQNESMTFITEGGVTRNKVVTLASGSVWQCRLTATNQFGAESDYSESTSVDFSRPDAPTGVGSDRIPVTININF